MWRSDDRGDAWRAVSDDLTRDQERLTLPILGSTQSWDNAWDLSAMSTFNTITSLAESPEQEGLLYAGTDDGLIQVSEDGGAAWRAVEVGTLPGVPAAAFVNDLRADRFDADRVYVALDDHKNGDYRPFLLTSGDRGRTWRSIAGDLPDHGMVWRIVQDHVRPELLFAATESGLWFTVDGGGRWTRLQGGVPTISFRDVKIHRRDDDLVAASFGRGIYVFDDLAVLREVSDATLDADATLFATRRAWWYVPRPVLSFEPGRGDQGAGHFVASNPPFGAVFTYHLRDGLEPRADLRQQLEKRRREAGDPTGFPGWEAVEAERRSAEPKIWLIVANEAGAVVRRVPGPTGRGFHRVAWDLRYPTPNAVERTPPPPPPWGLPPRGLLAPPGTYTVTLAQEIDGEVTLLSEPRPFDVMPLRRGALDGASPGDVATFWRRHETAVRDHSALVLGLKDLLARSERMREVIAHSRSSLGAFESRLHGLRADVQQLDVELNGDRSRQAVGEKHAPTIELRLTSVRYGIGNSTYGPTATHRRSLELAERQLAALQPRIDAAREAMATLADDLVAAGGPRIQ